MDGGATFSLPKNLSNNTGWSLEPRIALDFMGNINVVWEDNTPGQYDIFFAGGSVASQPTVTSISQTFGTQGDTITNFAVDGRDFQPISVLSFSGTGITVNSYSLRTTELIIASITIADSATPGLRDVIVSNGSKQSPPAGPFTVLQTPSGQLTLTPQNVLLTRGETNVLTATVRTTAGAPARRVLVNFQVLGANIMAGSVPTDSRGGANFSYIGNNKGVDTITASATVENRTVVSNSAFTEWGVVTVAFKMPLPQEPSKSWKVVTRVNDPADIFHQGNGYYSLDLTDTTPGLEAPVLAALDGIISFAGGVSKNFPPQNCPKHGSFGTFAMLDHRNGFETIHAHLKAGETLQAKTDDDATLGQVLDAMDSTGC
jgi:hypothetical protein